MSTLPDWMVAVAVDMQQSSFTLRGHRSLVESKCGNRRSISLMLMRDLHPPIPQQPQWQWAMNKQIHLQRSGHRLAMQISGMRPSTDPSFCRIHVSAKVCGSRGKRCWVPRQRIKSRWICRQPIIHHRHCCNSMMSCDGDGP